MQLAGVIMGCRALSLFRLQPVAATWDQAAVSRQHVVGYSTACAAWPRLTGFILLPLFLNCFTEMGSRHL
jgi:hypothetical protein